MRKYRDYRECRTCANAEEIDGENDLIRCHRFPPNFEGTTMDVFPLVPISSWCEEWESDKERIL